MATSVTPGPEHLDFDRMVSAIRRALLPIALLSGMAAIVAYAALSFVTPTYTSEAQILVGEHDLSDEYRGPTENDISSGRAADREAINSQVRLLMSQDLARPVVAELKLSELAEFNSSLDEPGLRDRLKEYVVGRATPDGQTTEQRVLNAFLSSLDVNLVKDSRVISVQFSSEDKFLAGEVPNKVAGAYINWLKAQKINQTKNARDWLETEIQRLRDEVQVAEIKIEKLRASSGLFVGDKDAVTLQAQQLADLNSELSRAKVLHAQARARAEAIHQLERGGDIKTSPLLQTSKLIQQLVSDKSRIESQIGQLSADLLPGHPSIRRLRSQAAALDTQITQEVTTFANGLKTEASEYALRVSSVQTSLDAIKANVLVSGDAAIKLRALEQDMESKRSTLNTYLKRLSDANSRRKPDAIPVAAAIISRSSPSLNPSFPRKTPLMLLVIAATILGGLSWVVLRELFRGSRGGNHARPVLKTVQRTGSAFANSSAQKKSITSQTLSDVSNRILQEPHGRVGQRILVRRDASGHNARFASRLATRLSSAGRSVILVDFTHHSPADMTDRADLRDILTGSAQFSEAIYSEPANTVHYLQACNVIDWSDVDLNVLQDVFEALAQTYDSVVVHASSRQADRLSAFLDEPFDFVISAGKSIELHRHNDIAREMARDLTRDRTTDWANDAIARDDKTQTSRKPSLGPTKRRSSYLRTTRLAEADVF